MNDGLAPAYVARVGGDLTQLENGPVVNRLAGYLLLSRRERNIDDNAFDIGDFHGIFLSEQGVCTGSGALLKSK